MFTDTKFSQSSQSVSAFPRAKRLYLFGCLLLSMPAVSMAQNLPTSGFWHVLNHEAVTLDHQTIVLAQQPQEDLRSLGKGRFAFSEMSFHDGGVDLVYTSGRNGDSTATSSQAYWPLAGSYSSLSPTLNVLNIHEDGCPAYAYEMQGNQLVLQRFTAQLNVLEFIPGTAEFKDPTFVATIIRDVEDHFECKEFAELLVTIRSHKAEFPAIDASRLIELRQHRIDAIKRLFAPDSIVARDQLQIEYNLAYGGPMGAPTVTFAFHKSYAWLENDSLRFKILPMTGTNYATASEKELQAPHFAQLSLSADQRVLLNKWAKADWIAHLEGNTTDFATSLILYSLTQQDIPAWFIAGPNEWKLYGKQQDLEMWKAYLQVKMPRL